MTRGVLVVCDLQVHSVSCESTLVTAGETVL